MRESSVLKVALLSLAALATTFLFVAAAHADAEADAKAVNDAFTKAIEACDVPAVLALYEDNAVVVWPGEGDFAIGKPGFEKIVRGYCSGPTKPMMTVISDGARPVGRDYIVHYAQLDATVAGPDGKPSSIKVRTTELLHRSAGKWRYAVDHASTGVAPPATGAKTP
jgi:uncharacterized protein (TIGR02246 family)